MRLLLPALAVALGLATLAPRQERAPTEARSLVAHLPDALPDISGWERSSGFAEFDAPRRSFEYELYVDPARGATYAVTRYWIRVDDPEERRKADITDTEKLQWDVDGRKLRRFECRPDPGGGACMWVEFEFDSPEYRRELKPVLAIYALHRKLLHERDDRNRD
jgi:hypothetical protein